MLSRRKDRFFGIPCPIKGLKDRDNRKELEVKLDCEAFYIWVDLTGRPRSKFPAEKWKKDWAICSLHWQKEQCGDEFRVPYAVDKGNNHTMSRDKPPNIPIQGIPESCQPRQPAPPRTTKNSLNCLLTATQCQFSEDADLLEVDLIEKNDLIPLGGFVKMKDTFLEEGKLDLRVDYVAFYYSNVLTIQATDFLGGIPNFVLKIHEDLSYKAYHKGTKITIAYMNNLHLHAINKYSQILIILNALVHFGSETCANNESANNQTLSGAKKAKWFARKQAWLDFAETLSTRQFGKVVFPPI